MQSFSNEERFRSKFSDFSYVRLPRSQFSHSFIPLINPRALLIAKGLWSRGLVRTLITIEKWQTHIGFDNKTFFSTSSVFTDSCSISSLIYRPTFENLLVTYSLYYTNKPLCVVLVNFHDL
jgi:hypothetical protein